MQEIENPRPATTTSTNGTKKEVAKTTPTKAVKNEATPRKRKVEVVSSEDEFVDPKPAPKTDKPLRSTPKKTKLSETKSPAKKVVTPVTKTSPKAAPKAVPKAAPKSAAKSTKKAAVDDTEGDLERKAILESVETVDLPDTEPAGDTKYPSSMTKLI
jgi:hypothetical protein